jgi:hypothetical protein
MSKRDWFGNATLALVAFGAVLAIGAIVYAIAIEQYVKRHHVNVGYQQSAEADRRRANEEIAQTCFQTDLTGFRDCISNHLETYYEQRANDEDLQAQQDMAYWAGAIFFLGLVQAGIAAAGIYYVAGSLKLTSESVQLANKAIAVENRPWVHLQADSVSDMFINATGVQTMIKVTVANLGNSPAQKSILIAERSIPESMT